MPTGLFIGRATMDVVGLVDEFPAADEKVTAREIVLTAGGPALNAAVTFAHLGGRATLVASFGDGPFAAAALNECRAHAVEVVDLAAGRAHAFPTSLVISAARGASRCIVNSPAGPAPNEPPAMLAPPTRPDIALLDQFEAPAAGLLVPALKESGVSVVLDGGSWKPDSSSFLEWATIPIVSARFRPPGCDRLEATIDRFARGSHTRWAITRGPQGVVWGENGTTRTAAAIPVAAVDTLAAGDIFHGAFCFAYAGGHRFEEALAFAAGIAAKSCRFAGPRAWMSADA